ncbi:hypothetical protein [Sphingomonas sp. RS2018]
MKRRYLVLTDEARRHPFRRTLPVQRVVSIDKPRDDDNDLKLFALSFTAFFICFYTLIA